MRVSPLRRLFRCSTLKARFVRREQDQNFNDRRNNWKAPAEHFPEHDDDEPRSKYQSGKRGRILREQEKEFQKLTFIQNFDHIPIEDQIFMLFPGVGSQHTGMGKQVIDNPSSSRIFEEANELLGFNLLDMCLNGPKSKLDQTIYSPLAVFVSSVAALEKFKVEQPDATNRITEVAGYSVGEYCALVLGEILKFKDALKLIKLGSEMAHECNQMVSAGMMTVRHTKFSKLKDGIQEAREHAREQNEYALCETAVYLAQGIDVVAGSNLCLDHLEANANRFKYQVAKRLPIQGAYHTILMMPVKQELEKALANIEIGVPRYNVYSNFTGKVYPRREKDIKKCIYSLISNPVKWEQILQLIYRKHQDFVFPSLFEIGPGQQIGATLKVTSKKIYENYVNYPC